VVWGQQDNAMEDFFATPPDDLCPRLVVERLPDATHWVHLDEPDQVNERLLAFFA
jgi:pimeloyl-ACP methyl ester carboxylesterase